MVHKDTMHDSGSVVSAEGSIPDVVLNGIDATCLSQKMLHSAPVAGVVQLVCCCCNAASIGSILRWSISRHWD